MRRRLPPRRAVVPNPVPSSTFPASGLAFVVVPEAALEGAPGDRLGVVSATLPGQFGPEDLVTLSKGGGEAVDPLLERRHRGTDLGDPRLQVPWVARLLGNRPGCVAGLDGDPVPLCQGEGCAIGKLQDGDGVADHPQPPRVGELGPEAELGGDDLPPEGDLTDDQRRPEVGLDELLQRGKVDCGVDATATPLPRQGAVIHGQAALSPQRPPGGPGLELVQGTQPALVGSPVPPSHEWLDAVGDAELASAGTVHTGTGSGTGTGTGSGMGSGAGTGSGAGKGSG